MVLHERVLPEVEHMNFKWKEQHVTDARDMFFPENE